MSKTVINLGLLKRLINWNINFSFIDTLKQKEGAFGCIYLVIKKLY